MLFLATNFARMCCRMGKLYVYVQISCKLRTENCSMASPPFCNILLPCLDATILLLQILCDGSCCFFLLCNFSVMGLVAIFPFAIFPMGGNGTDR